MTTILSPETLVAKQISTVHKQFELSTHLQLANTCVHMKLYLQST
jgi:hypothetical protein